MPFKWDSVSERHLLILAMQECDMKPPSTIWDAVAEQIGTGVNANACSQRFYKLKRESDELLKNAEGSGDVSAPATPTAKAAKTLKTPKNPKTGPKKPTGKGKRKTTKDDSEGDVEAEADSNAGDEKPAKKTKKTKQANDKVEAEADSNDGDEQPAKKNKKTKQANGKAEAEKKETADEEDVKDGDEAQESN